MKIIKNKDDKSVDERVIPMDVNEEKSLIPYTVNNWKRI